MLEELENLDEQGLREYARELGVTFPKNIKHKTLMEKVVKVIADNEREDDGIMFTILDQSVNIGVLKFERNKSYSTVDFKDDIRIIEHIDFLSKMGYLTYNKGAK